MVTAQRTPKEEESEGIKYKPLEKLLSHSGGYTQPTNATSFGRNYAAVEELVKWLIEFKNRGGEITINEIGLGTASVSPLRRWKDISYEPSEILNAARKAGIAPSQFTLYAIDINPNAPDAAKKTDSLEINVSEENKKYVREFFPNSQKGEEPFVSVEIPQEYRERIICEAPLDIRKEPVPHKADITFSFLHLEASYPYYLVNLVKSTKDGGIIITDVFIDSADLLKELGLEKLNYITWRHGAEQSSASVYRVKSQE